MRNRLAALRLNLIYLFQEVLQESGYLTARHRVLLPIGKENTQPNKRIRKALAPSWSTPGNISVPGVTDVSYTVETPVGPSQNSSCTNYHLMGPTAEIALFSQSSFSTVL
jgi:hypothetical protein